MVSLRYFNAAGADIDCEIGENHNPESHLIPLVLDAAIGKRDSISIFGDDYNTDDGTCVRDYIHVEDLADAHLKALQYLEEPFNDSNVFNLLCNILKSHSMTAMFSIWEMAAAFQCVK